MRLRAKQSLQRIEITVYSPAIRLLLNLQKLPSSKKLSVLLIYCTKVPEKVILLSRWTDNILPSGGFRRMVSRLLLLVDTEGQSYPKDKMAFSAESEFESTRQVLTKRKVPTGKFKSHQLQIQVSLERLYFWTKNNNYTMRQSEHHILNDEYVKHEICFSLEFCYRYFIKPKMKM